MIATMDHMETTLACDRCDCTLKPGFHMMEPRGYTDTYGPMKTGRNNGVAV